MKIRADIVFLMIVTLMLVSGMSCSTARQAGSAQLLQAVIDSAYVEGSVLIYDHHAGVWHSNDFEWCKKASLPASTFKIPNSLIALETGVVESENTLFAWDGAKRSLQIWERDMNFREAFHSSCVPCFQDIARRIGPLRMQEYLEKFDYGDVYRHVSAENIDIFWLAGESGISQQQQVDFLKRFYFSELPISSRTEEIMKKLMVIEKTDHYTLSGKTGWAIRNGGNTGWFVGYLETRGHVYFIATNIIPAEAFKMENFNLVRKQVSMEAFKALKIIKEV